jgi:xylulokinase
MNAVLGIDIGTQGTKAALFSEEGACLASAFKKSKLLQPQPGSVEENPEDQIAAVCQTIRSCLRQARIDAASVRGLGIAGQMAGIIGIDKKGLHITPYDSWLDTRCAPQIEEMAKAAGAQIIRKTGGPPSFNHGPKILWWMKRQPRAYKKIHGFVQPAGYAVMRLCGMSGASAFIDKTYLHFSGFADNARARWDSNLCSQFELDPAKLPRIVDSHHIAGELIPSMARRCGLRPGAPVIFGCGDSAASFLACGATRPGISVDVAGTAAVFAATTQCFRPDLESQTLCCAQAATPGLWHPYAYINGGGLNLEWFRTQVCASKNKRKPMERSLADLDQAAMAISPNDQAPMFIPHLGGRVSPGWPRLRGSWANLHWQHTSADLYRAMLEAVPLEYRIYQQVVHFLHPDLLPITELRVTGGGEKSLLWNQLKADILQLPVMQVTRPEGAALGAGLLAGFGVGLLPDLDAAARRWIRPGRTSRPNPKLAPYYEKRFERYRELLTLLNQWSQTCLL